MPLAIISLPYIIARLGSFNAILFAAAVLAVYFAVVTGIERYRKYHSRNWPTVPGAITDVTEEFKSEPNAVDYWRVHFVYNYSIEGKDYSGKYHVNCVTENIKNDCFAGVQNNQIAVHYNPRNPAKSLLWEDEVWNLW